MSSVDIKGLETLYVKLDKIGSAASLKRKAKEVGNFLEEEARVRAPKDTGALIGSIENKVESTVNNIEVTVFAGEHYAPYQEFGTGLFAVNGDGRKTGWAYEDPHTGERVWTRGNRPHPFMGPALRENKDVILQYFKEGLDD